jgi:hypothetical protein
LPGALRLIRDLGLTAIRAERVEPESLRSEDQIAPNTYPGLQQQLDWSE